MRFYFVLVLTCAAAATVRAAQVELQLVVHDKLDTTVDKMERQRPITRPVSGSRGVEMKTVGLDLACWARNIRLDDKQIFERYFDGKYVDRLPVARAELQPGEHTIWPGKHVFAVNKDGSITTKSEYLIVEKNVVRIKCFPVTVRAFIANPEEGDLPPAMRIAALPNMTVRDAMNFEQNAASKDKKSPELRELLPYGENFKSTDKFAPLTIWLPANISEKGYVLYPSGLTFHLGPDGVVGGAEKGRTIAGIRIENFLIEVPIYNYPVFGAAGCKLIVPDVEEFSWSKNEKQTASWYPRFEPYELKLAEMGNTLNVDGDFSELPFKSIALDRADPASGAQRGVIAELSTRHFKAGTEIQVRVRSLDTRNGAAAFAMKTTAKNKAETTAQSANAAQQNASKLEGALKAVQASVAKAQKEFDADSGNEILKDTVTAAQAFVEPAVQAFNAAKQQAATAAKISKDAAAFAELQSAEALKSAGGNPLENAPVFAEIQAYGESAWTALHISAGKNGDATISIPDLPNAVYHLRLGVRPADAPSIAVEQWVTIASPKATAIGLFTARGRQAFYRGNRFGLRWARLAAKGLRRERRLNWT